MDLRSLKREVEAWPCAAQMLQDFQKELLPEDLDQELKEKIDLELKQMAFAIEHLLDMPSLRDKFKLYIRHLIELKLSRFKNDRPNAKRITYSILGGERLQLADSISEVKQFSKYVRKMENHYENISQIVHDSLPLEHSVIYAQGEHNKHFSELKQLAQDQKVMIKNIGTQFVELAKTW